MKAPTLVDMCEVDTIARHVRMLAETPEQVAKANAIADELMGLDRWDFEMSRKIRALAESAA